jgi:hypothetical protein
VRIFFGGRNSRQDATLKDTSSPASISTLQGHVVSSTISKNLDVAIFVDYEPKDMENLRELKRLGVPLVLIKQEPVVTAPLHAKHNPSGLFDLIITRGDPGSKPRFNTFQEWDTRFVDNSTRVDRVVAINANKWSAMSGELYSLRRKCYSFDSRVDLFGREWNERPSATLVRVLKENLLAVKAGFVPQVSNIRHAFFTPANYLGVTDDKMLTLSKYKVSLVIENSETYMSEKLVDAILAGCIPVYVGANPELFGIPRDLYIRSTANAVSVGRSLDIALNASHSDFLRRVRHWVDTPGTRSKWESVEVFSQILSHIENELLITFHPDE